MPAEGLNALWARAIVEELVRSGLRHAVICPGSRSTPLTLAFAATPEVRCWSVVDERSAAFFALGIGKQSGVSAAVVATSGTAGAHFHPAIIEAWMANVPLIALTADRPVELHGWGAPQSIPQHRLYGQFTRFFADLGAPEARSDSLLHLRAVTDQAIAASMSSPRGPVHLNVPFREPLAPEENPPELPPLSELALHGRGRAPFTRISSGVARTADATLARIAERLRQTERGVIVIGPRDASDGLAEAAVSLGRALAYPVFAEACSNARFGQTGEVSCAYDAVVRHPPFAAAMKPDLVLHLGGPITAKTVQAFVDGATVIQLSDEGALLDPNHAAAEIIVGDPTDLIHRLANVSRPATSWLKSFLEAERRARAVFEAELSGALTEPAAAHALAKAVPEGANLFVSSSMPIRDLDAFAFRGARFRTFCNRGANGIDGINSTALGVAAASGRPTVLLTGDLALLHDLGGLLAARRHGLNLTIVAINNDGGGIFSFLPIANRTEKFEELFGTPHGVELEKVAALADARFVRCATAEELERAVARGVEGGLHLIEVRTARAANVAEHRRLFAKVAAALGEGPWG